MQHDTPPEDTSERDPTDKAYLAQRQSTMDSETLDKLLMAEKNLFQAGQATMHAWSLIGRRTAECEGEENDNMNIPPSSPTSSLSGRTPTAASSAATSASSATMAMPIPMNGSSHHHSNGNNQQQQQQLAPLAPMSSSPKFPMEIPRPEGRSSLGSYSNAASRLYEKPLSFSLRSVTSVDSASTVDMNAMAEHGRTRSHHGNLFGFQRDAPPRSEVTLFTFTVKKSDSVLEKLGSKKASIQVQVDTEARMISFLSPHDSRENYSCAAVTARPYSRLGMQLKIQTGNASLTKKITFFSIEDRANFLQSLEEGKVMYKKSSVPSLRPTETISEESFSFANTADSTSSSNKKIRESIVSDHLNLLPGETVLEHVQRVTNLVVISQSDRAVQGVLKITTYRITFSPYDAAWKFGSFELPLAAIDLITRDGLMLLISCKDLRTIRLAMHDAYSRKKGYDQLPSTPDFRWLNLLTLRMKPPSMIGALFAFDYHAERTKERDTPIERNNGWYLYSPVGEYQRLGFLRGNDSAASKRDAHGNGVTWRLLKNSKFRFSPTYPQLMVVPALMTEEQLVQSARFRSKARLPVVVWRHPVNKSVLARSSQPNYGMAGNRSEPDRILLRAYRDSANTNSANIVPPLHIVDARKPIATTGNRLKGKGTVEELSKTLHGIKTNFFRLYFCRC